MVTLNSKLHVSGKQDIWWYNLSTPSRIKTGDTITLNLWDNENKTLIKKIKFKVDSNRRKKILSASTHWHKKTEILKIHAQRSHQTHRLILYFGKKTDGTYHIP